MKSNIDENVILFDWLSFTSKQHSPQELIAAMGLSHFPFSELETGANGYNCRLYFDHIHVCYNGGNDDHGGMGVNVFMSGQGCRVFESNSTLKNCWMDLFGFIFSNNLNICRLDVAYDDHSGLLDIKRVCADTFNHLYISPFRTDSVTATHNKDGIEALSATVGSMKGKILVRIYDKAAERGFTDGRHWVRVETQAHDERAAAFAEAIFTSGLPIGEVYAGVLLNYLRFVEPDETDSNRSRWTTADYWYNFLGDVSRIPSPGYYAFSYLRDRRCCFHRHYKGGETLMEIISKLFSVTLAIFQLPITIFGYTFSFWEVFCFSVVAGIVAYIIGGFFNGD